MIRRAQLLIKFFADRLLALLALVLLSPLCLLRAILSKLDDGGPVFFRHKRAGYRQTLFEIWKFRSMIVNADNYLDQQGAPTANRITRVGKILRQASLDELPQLYNILIGDMSIVGPRPVLPEHIQRYTPEQRRRFKMRPGLTGLAQINGRNTLKWSRRLAFDVQYVDEFNLLLDVKIILKTVVMLTTTSVTCLDRNPDDVNDLPARGDKAQ
jgi:lipopolysaccharide/colanic/teichoic acid biosynthesis glycosyltransferase